MGSLPSLQDRCWTAKGGAAGLSCENFNLFLPESSPEGLASPDSQQGNVFGPLASPWPGGRSKSRGRDHCDDHIFYLLEIAQHSSVCLDMGADFKTR